MDQATPTAQTSRIRSLDLLRGVAVLGIFVMNSRNFGLPLQQFDNPAFPGRAGSPTNPSTSGHGASATSSSKTR